MNPNPKTLIPKRPLQPPKPRPTTSSHSQKLASKDEVTVKLQKGKSIPVHLCNFQATPQPFLDWGVERGSEVEAEEVGKKEEEGS
ncbi:hypothetical protein HYFRA_00011068 [Hymenoscyphus fraxineus]|uniref:Uncharacterized protein n=1 Tax=Hymenoscyphus fraxineus TaxID=746836 RepID=A0A9N9L200_9HELO|nr:hypothetical protein HYFRA_00011068 [Hymenoscyphus fraxineus]